MCDTLTANAARRYDPTKTTTLRQQFEREAVRRFKSLRRAIVRELVDLDGFGLRTNAGRFDFPRDADKTGSFMAWLRQQVDAGILEIRPGETVQSAADRNWSSVYVRSAYHKGMGHSAAELRRDGVSVAPEWITEAFTRPFHADRVGLIYTRSYDELRGITSEMDRQISRALADGMARGDGARTLSAALLDRVDKIGITRARMMARTETIRAHAEASLNSYQEAGIMGIDVRAEFQTARDDKVCQICKAIADGGPYTIDTARGIIPAHPNCRCAWVPRVENPKSARLS